MQRLKRLLKWVATGSFSLILAACYGVMYSMQQTTGRVIAKSSSSGAPIPGLSVTVRGTDERHYETDEAGEVAYRATGDYVGEVRVLVEDVDGTANGGEFAPEQVLTTGGTETVELDPVGSSSDEAE